MAALSACKFKNILLPGPFQKKFANLCFRIWENLKVFRDSWVSISNWNDIICSLTQKFEKQKQKFKFCGFRKFTQNDNNYLTGRLLFLQLWPESHLHWQFFKAFQVFRHFKQVCFGSFWRKDWHKTLVIVNEIPYVHLHSDAYIYLTPISFHAILYLSFLFKKKNNYVKVSKIKWSAEKM